MIDQKIIPDAVLREIFIRAVHEDKKNDFCLSESSLSYLLTEQLDEKDVKKVRKSIERAEKQIKSLSSYLDSINLDRSLLGDVDDYIDSLTSALDKANSELAGLNIKALGNNKLTNFFGQKVTLPQITQAAIALHTKAMDFGTGFSKAITAINDNLGPLVKNDADKSVPIIDLAGSQGIPDEEVISRGLNKAISKALGGGFFAKVKSFFGKAMSGSEKKIMDVLPDFNLDNIANSLTDAVLTASINDLSQPPPTPEPEAAKSLETVAKVSQETETETASQTTEAETEEASEDTSELWDLSPSDLEGSKPGETEKKWSDIRDELLSSAEDKTSTAAILKSLVGQASFRNALKSHIVFKEGYTQTSLVYETKISSLLFETVSFVDFVKMGDPNQLDDNVDKEQVFNDLALSLNDSVDSDVITDISQAETASVEDPSPADSEESAEAIEDSDTELRDAAQTAVAQSASPLDAALDAIRSWNTGLSKSSQQSLAAKNRLKDLTGGIKDSLEASATAIEGQVADAISNWRTEHEEALLKSKRFSKKNFDSLEKLIPQLAVAMLKKSNESKYKLTKSDVQRITFKYMNSKFKDELRSGVLYEVLLSNTNTPNINIDNKDIIDNDGTKTNRLLQLAGLGDDD